VQQNQDELAKQALMRRSEHISRGDQLNLTWQAHKQETDRLKDSLRTLNDNIEEANRKKNLLLAKQRRADAQKRINETMSHISEKSAFEAFARMEEKIEANERKVRASAEIEEESIPRAVIGKLAQEVDLRFALHGGEDYELLFSVPRGRRIPLRIAGVPVTEIGRIVRGKRVVITTKRGEAHELVPQGWQHFARNKTTAG